MSLLDTLLGGFLSDDENTAANTPKPCDNCAANCPFCPDACAECKPYKEKLSELMYDVDHLEAYYDRYEIVGTADANAGNTICPHCFAPNPAYATACEYCGSQLRESSGKIRVASGKDIPNPILEAQNIIFERQNVVEKYEEPEVKGGLLDALAGLFGESSNDNVESLGDRMTEDEIKSAAQSYGVSVGAYLTGLDNGKYLTLSAKKAYDRVQTTRPAAASTGMGGMAGMAGLGGLAGLGMLGGIGRAQTARNAQANPFGVSRPTANDLFAESRRARTVQMPQTQTRPQTVRDPFAQDRRPGMGRPDSDRPGMGRPGMNRPDSDRPGMGRPGMGRPDSDRPGMGRPDADRTAAAKPNLSFSNKPAASKPAAVKPAPTNPNASLGSKFGRNETIDPKKAPQPAAARQVKNDLNKSRAGGKKPGGRGL